MCIVYNDRGALGFYINTVNRELTGQLRLLMSPSMRKICQAIVCFWYWHISDKNALRDSFFSALYKSILRLNLSLSTSG